MLTVPSLLEPALCQALIEEYDRWGGTRSGFMREVDRRDGSWSPTTASSGVAVRRSTNPALRTALVARIRRRLAPDQQRRSSRGDPPIERYIVAAYDAEPGGYFYAHRDNPTKGTAHRRFAVTINLNDDYEGGNLRFPEFGSPNLSSTKGRSRRVQLLTPS